MLSTKTKLSPIFYASPLVSIVRALRSLLLGLRDVGVVVSGSATKTLLLIAYWLCGIRVVVSGSATKTLLLIAY